MEGAVILLLGLFVGVIVLWLSSAGVVALCSAGIVVGVFTRLSLSVVLLPLLGVAGILSVGLLCVGMRVLWSDGFS